MLSGDDRGFAVSMALFIRTPREPNACRGMGTQVPARDRRNDRAADARRRICALETVVPTMTHGVPCGPPPRPTESS